MISRLLTVGGAVQGAVDDAEGGGQCVSTGLLDSGVLWGSAG
jgi:hypothetical protein